MIKTLNGKWKFRSADNDAFYPATVPGCNFTDLMAEGLISDPFDGLNERDCAFVGEKDWVYERDFTVTKDELSADGIMLCFDMLDTICDLFLNGALIGKGENCHLKYTFDVKDILREGENTLKVHFRSPVKYVEEIYKKEGAPMNSNGQNGIVHIRKPQCHFGWDWGPVLPISGITKDVYLDFITAAEISKMEISQVHSENKVKIKAECLINALTDEKTGCTVTLTHPDGTKESVKGDKVSFTVENPELWWTYELSGKEKQPLYTLTATLKKGNKVISVLEKKIGLRTIELDRSRDEYGSNFRFILNGVPVFVKGGNFIPADSLITRFGEKEMQTLLDAARFSNFNMIRVWGGGYYESDEFYNKCDEMGILLWQDFPFACQAYPFFKEDFLQNVKREIEYNVNRLKHHACLAIWCGNNEIEAMSGGWMHMRDYIKWTEKFFYHILPDEVRKYDSVTPFIPGSPCGTDDGKGINADNVGDTHLWSVWHGMSNMREYRNRPTRFCSEFGFESLPDEKTIRTFAKKEDYALDSEVFRSHQKCNSGNDKMFYYIRSRFKLPSRFEDFIYLSQITQLECIKDATEFWRRNKGRCNGAIYWQFNDCWPVCSWASIDFYGNYKALQYGARHFNAPLSLCFDDNERKVSAVLLNDLNERMDVILTCEIFDFENEKLIQSKKKKLTLEPLENKNVFTLYRKQLARHLDLKKTGLRISLECEGFEKVSKTYLFEPEKKLELPEAKITMEKGFADGKITVKLSADKFARLVRVESSLSSLPFSDNFFDLLAGEEKTVTMALDDAFSPEEQLKSITVMSLCDVPTREITMKERISQIKMMLSPTNIGNCVYHRQTPADAKA